MATAKNLILVHEHLCMQCGADYFCNDPLCAPPKPGRTYRLCDPCASHPLPEPKRYSIQDQILILKTSLQKGAI